MIVEMFGRLWRVESLPPPISVSRRWDGGDQAYPVTFAAQMGRAMRRMSMAMIDLADSLGGGSPRKVEARRR